MLERMCFLRNLRYKYKHNILFSLLTDCGPVKLFILKKNHSEFVVNLNNVITVNVLKSIISTS